MQFYHWLILAGQLIRRRSLCLIYCCATLINSKPAHVLLQARARQPMLLARVLLSAVALCFTAQVCSQPQQEQQLLQHSPAECSLVLLGHGSGQLGVAYASLNCSSAGGLVPVAVNATHMQQHAASFRGVTVMDSSDCANHAATSSAGVGRKNVHALLYFCGNHSLILNQPVVKGVALVDVSSSSHSDDPALLLFGGSIQAGIDGGQFDGNTAGTALMAMQRATLQLHGTLVNAHVGARAMALIADGSAVVTIDSSTLSNMLAAAALARDQATLVVEGSTFRNNSCNYLDPHGPSMLEAQGASTATLSNSVFSRNTVHSGTVVYVADEAQVGGNHQGLCIAQRTHMRHIQQPGIQFCA
jgi:hypothetical protein